MEKLKVKDKHNQHKNKHNWQQKSPLSTSKTIIIHMRDNHNTRCRLTPPMEGFQGESIINITYSGRWFLASFIPLYHICCTIVIGLTVIIVTDQYTLRICICCLLQECMAVRRRTNGMGSRQRGIWLSLFLRSYKLLHTSSSWWSWGVYFLSRVTPFPDSYISYPSSDTFLKPPYLPPITLTYFPSSYSLYLPS